MSRASVVAPPGRVERSRSVRREITAGVVLLVVSFAGVGSWSLAQQQRAVEALRLANEGYLQLQASLGEARVNQGMLNTLLDRLLDDRDRVSSRTWIGLARRSRRARLGAARSLAEGRRAEAREADDRAILGMAAETLGAIDRAWAEDEPRFDALFAALGAGDTAEAQRVNEQLLTREGDVEYRLTRLTRALQRRTAVISDQAERQQGRALRLTLAATALAVFLGVLTLVTARRALAPLTALRDRARAVARGDLAPGAVRARDDEIGELAGEFERMVGAVGARDAALRGANAEIRKAERHLELVLGTLRSGVLVVRREGAVEGANAAGVAFLGSAAEGFWGSRLGRETRVADAVRAVFAGEGATTLEAVPVGEAAYDVTVVPFVEPGVEAPSALVVADDVTERERARGRVMQAERLAAIGRMAAHVTHEVRNPLSSIGLNAEMLADEVALHGDAGRESLRLVRAIQREIDRLTGVTEEYLRMARLPQPRLEREPLGDLVTEAVSFAAEELRAAGVALRVEVEPGLPSVLVDEAQLRQALLNLLRNAREAMEEARVDNPRLVVRVASRAHPTQAERAGVAVSVCDAGPGLDPATAARVWEVFYTTKSRGTGLGLALTRELLTAHGGDVWAGRAAPEDGGGAEFVLWLPVAAEG